MFNGALCALHDGYPVKEPVIDLSSAVFDGMVFMRPAPLADQIYQASRYGAPDSYGLKVPVHQPLILSIELWAGWIWQFCLFVAWLSQVVARLSISTGEFVNVFQPDYRHLYLSQKLFSVGAGLLPAIRSMNPFSSSTS